MDNSRTYIAIDLKSFYASVECMDRGLDPLTTHLVVADASRTEKTICLAVSPSLKSYGISGRARLFEVVQKMKEVNRQRLGRLRGKAFRGSSWSAPELAADPFLEADYITAVPRMKHYMGLSTRIYKIYLRYIAPEDIHVYSIDEVMIDATKYLPLYHTTAHELAMEMIRAVLGETGITATAGIGPNLYLAKVAMDIEAKHIRQDADGVRIAELDEMSYRKKLWGHRPITDFWRVGRGYAASLARHGMFTMGDVARCSVRDEDLLYNLFGINAELLIDHAWGWEPCTIDLIKAYVPQFRSFSSGQVLSGPCGYEQTRIIVREMADAAAISLFEKRMLTDQVVLTLCYDTENLSDPEILKKYTGSVKKDRYGRRVPKDAHGTENIRRPTSSSRQIIDAVLALYDRIADPVLKIRRIYLDICHVVDDTSDLLTPRFLQEKEGNWEQLDLFTDYENLEKERKQEQETLEKERRLQDALLAIRQKYGKNAILKGTSLQEGATMRQRNDTVGGHRA